MNRIQPITILTALVFSLHCFFTSDQTIQGEEITGPPNLIFILADDLGYGDLGCFGQERIKTPRLDQMAQQGMKLTDFYSGSTVCAPSRCVLMTGYHTGHCRIRGNSRLSIGPEDITLAEILKNAGYKTCLSGKWGLGEEGTSGVPTQKGFDAFYGYLNQRHAHNYYPTFLIENESRVQLKNRVDKEDKFGAGKADEKIEYSHDLIMDHALNFVRGHADEPFFLYLALTIPHANNEAGKEGMEVPELGDYEETDWPDPQKGHAAMITRMDRDCGRLLDLLNELNIADNTLVMFTSDNGPHAEGGNKPDFNQSSGPLRGIKRSLHEGGIRVPTIAWWPNTIAAGSTSDHIGCFQDIMPTFAQLAGCSEDCPEDIDGISMVATLKGEGKQKQHDFLYWAFYEQGGAQAARKGDWKIIQQPMRTKPRLYNLADDLKEADEIGNDHPDIYEEMIALMRQAYTESERWKFPENN